MQLEQQPSKARHYRGEAERVRRKASAVRDAVIREELLGMARQYDELAVSSEREEFEEAGDERREQAARQADDATRRQFYSSLSGDRWLLGRDAETGRIYVRHEANEPSGGHKTDYSVGAFLSGPQNAEQKALLELISGLITAGATTSSDGHKSSTSVVDNSVGNFGARRVSNAIPIAPKK